MCEQEDKNNKMKLIAITQRVEEYSKYKERRDVIDQKWIELLISCDFVPVLVPNNITAAKEILNELEISGIIFTGGNSLVKYEGDASERDEVERFCLEFAINKNIPVLGVCRGMQVIQDYFGIELYRISGHVMKVQKINWLNNPIMVNSYHNWGTKETVDDLIITGISDDGIVKSIVHKYKLIHGIMWHPERISPFTLRDIKFIKKIFNEDDY